MVLDLLVVEVACGEELDSEELERFVLLGGFLVRLRVQRLDGGGPALLLDERVGGGLGHVALEAAIDTAEDGVVVHVVEVDHVVHDHGEVDSEEGGLR